VVNLHVYFCRRVVCLPDLLLCCVQVIIGAPSVIEDDLLRTFNISLVVRGSITETRGTDSDNGRCVEQHKL
jgi:hypothetical protein